MLRSSGNKKTFASSLLRQFSKLDRDGNGTIVKKEIEDSLADRDLSGDAAACTGTLYSKRALLGRLSRLSNEQLGPERGLTRNDIEKLEESPIEELEKRYQEHVAKQSVAVGQLYVNEGPTASGVCQGSVANCWLLAPLASLAAKRPQEIKNRISALPSGQFEVRLPTGSSVKVDAPTPSELLAFTSGTKGESWATVYESGVSQKYAVFSQEARTRAGLHYGFINSGFKHTTGNSCDTDWLPITNDQTLREKLIGAETDDRIVVLASSKYLIHSEKSGILSGHCYSLLGFDEEKDELLIRNPWGEKEWTDDPQAKDGVFRMPLTEVRRHFSTVSYEEVPS